MKKIVVCTVFGVIGLGVFFSYTQPSTFDFLMDCPEKYYPENLFCYPDNMMVDTAASDWLGRFMMINEPIIFDP